MGKLMFGGFLALVGIVFLLVSAAQKEGRSAPVLRSFGLLGIVIGGFIAVAACMVVIDPGEVGVRHAFGVVDVVGENPKPDSS